MAQERQVDALEQCIQDMTLYGVYVARHRSVPDFRDGLKEVQRKIIYAMFHDFNPKQTSKSSAITGTVMYKYHPHGDAAIYGSMKPLANWFEIYKPLIDSQGNFGNFQGDGPAAARYTEVKLSKFALDVFCDELSINENVVDWEPNYTGDWSMKVPKVLPCKLPMLLINGCFGIAVGFKSDVPSHNINEVIDATVKLIDNPNARVVLIPDHQMDCDIIDTDWKNISRSGFGSYKVRGHVDIGEYKHKPALFIHSLPNMVYLNAITDKIEKLITSGKLTQIHDMYENSKETLEYIIVLKKGSDPSYVRDVLFKETDLESSFRVNFEVLSDKKLIRMDYKSYLLEFLDFRRQTKLRLYRNLEQNLMTKNHIIEFFIIAITSGLADKILQMIKKTNADNDNEIIEYILKSMAKIAPDKHYTSTQVKRFINMPVKYFSKKNIKRYKDEYKENETLLKEIHPKTDINALDQEIRQELLDLKHKYGEPRRCKVISQASISNIPEGTFRVVITSNNTVKKFGIDEPFKFYKGEYVVATAKVENTDNLVVFDTMGRVFSIPVHKIPLTERGSNGTDIRSINKRIVSNIAMIIPESLLDTMHNKANYTVMVLTASGNIKKMILNDFISVTAGGLIYAKLDQGDYVKDILFIQNGKNHIVVYSDKKALCFDASSVPVLRRNTKGVRAMQTESVDGMSVISPKAQCIVVLTNFGYINKLNIGALKVKKRAAAGDNLIKLTSGDTIKAVFTAEETNKILIQTSDGNIEIPVADIKEGSSVSKGTRIKNIKNSIINAKLQK